MRETVSFVFTFAGFCILLALVGHDDLLTMQGIANNVNVVDSIAAAGICLMIGWLIGGKK